MRMDAALAVDLLGSAIGAIAGATIARLLGSEDHIPTAAIAGAFIGGGLATSIRRRRIGRRSPPQ
jgi:uncharacterized protein YcfJ